MVLTCIGCGKLNSVGMLLVRAEVDLTWMTWEFQNLMLHIQV